MVKSMTGYGRETGIIADREITVEIRSVNHRYFDYTARVPRNYGFLEEKLKAGASKYISRGKVDVYASISSVGGLDTEITINEPLLNNYLKALEAVAAKEGVANDISVSTIARFSDIFSVNRREEDAETLWGDVSKVATAAFESFNNMRTAEGKKLYEDLFERAGRVLEMVGQIEAFAAGNAAEYKDKLAARIKELLGEASVDENRLMNELAYYADRTAIDEETVRLRSHISQFCGLLKETVPVGRKLDFLIQEMNREINTIGSKSGNLAITKTVVEVKAELEKIREQAQNIE